MFRLFGFGGGNVLLLSRGVRDGGNASVKNGLFLEVGGVYIRARGQERYEIKPGRRGERTWEGRDWPWESERVRDRQ